jgi:hypothetical protein
LDKDPGFATQIALQAIRDLLAEKGYDPTTLDAIAAFDFAIAGASRLEKREWVEKEIRCILNQADALGSAPLMCQAVRRSLEAMA